MDSLENTASALLERHPFGWLRERDIDLLLCAELHANGALVKYIASQLRLQATSFAESWVSHPEIDGETDLLISFGDTPQRIVVLVENKIAAPFQRDQALRYQARRSRWAERAEVARAITLLIAPATYMSRPEASIFDHQISYEELASALEPEGDGRSKFLATALRTGIEVARRGYVMNPDAAVSAMWEGFWQIASKLVPRLNLERPTLKPGKSTWIYFNKAEGFSENDRKRVVIAYKAERGQADLQFARTDAADLERRTAGIRSRDMTVVQAKKSASLRLAVPSIDFVGSVADQQDAIRSGMLTCEALRAFFVENRSTLLP